MFLSGGSIKIALAFLVSRESSFYRTFECSYYVGVDHEVSETIWLQGSASPL
jgi:hypothetical protein